MSETFTRPDISYKPKEILNDNVNTPGFYKDTNSTKNTVVEEESLKVADRLLEHLKLIKQYQKRLDTLDYLIDNASSLTGELSYTTDDDDIKNAITAYGYTGNVVTFEMFKRAVSDIIDNYNNMVINSIAGLNS